MTITHLTDAARAASAVLKTAPTAIKNRALGTAAALLRARCADILDANARDMDRAKVAGLSPAALDRLMLDPDRVESIAKGLDVIIGLPDPVGQIIQSWKGPQGLDLSRVRVPLGVIGIIFESRPNVTADAAALCLKSGNACLLRPGSESFESARAIADLFTAALDDAGLPAGCIQMVPSADRTHVGDMLTCTQGIDVIIPRGGKSLIARVQSESRVPVLAHLDGNCHLYIHEKADPDMAERVLLNAKMRRTGICGATEKLLIDQNIAPTLLPRLLQALLRAGCAVRGDQTAMDLNPAVTAASDDDWGTEYLAPLIAVKTVSGLDQAIAHIERYGSHHTDSIITNDPEAAAHFIAHVDSAIVMHNASTQFADGGEFGMGAEIGIATGRLHARGPVGLEELTTYKNIVRGGGAVRA